MQKLYLGLKKTLPMCLLMISISCNTPSKEQQSRISPIEEASLEIKDNQIEGYISLDELKHLMAIKAVFDSSLCFQGTIENLEDCYLSHAQSYSYDMVKQIEQLNQNYPYNTAFELNKVKVHADGLNFLSKNCGFQNEKTGEIVNFYCLKNKSSFIDYLTELGEDNALIQIYQENYTKNKVVSNDIKKRIGATGQFELDFERLDHQIFYLFYHLMINEEVKARQKISN